MSSVADVTAAIQSGEVILLQASATKNLEVQLEVLNKLTGAGIVVLHVSTMRPSLTLKALLSKNGVVDANVRFIDAVEGSGSMHSSKDTIYVQGPQDLTGIVLAVQKFIDTAGSKLALFIESTSGLEMNNDPTQVVRLMHALVTKVRLARSGAVISSGTDAGRKTTTNDIALLCDRIISLT